MADNEPTLLKTKLRRAFEKCSKFKASYKYK